QRKLKETKTDSSKRDIPLPTELGARLHGWIREHRIGPNDLVFTNQKGRPMHAGNFVKRNLRRAGKRAGVTPDVDFQMLRRTWATMAYAVERDLKAIQSQMGHSRPDMTLGEYIQPVDDKRRQLAQRMEDILIGKESIPVDLAMKFGS